MPRILLDENIPVALKNLLVGLDVSTVRDMGWTGLSNGKLLAAAEDAGFEVLLTADQNVQYQQNMAARRIALVILSTSRWSVVRTGTVGIIQALQGLSAGDYREVKLPRPRRQGRPAPARGSG